MREGLSEAFALAREVEVVGVCSLDAIECHEAEYVVATDARRKEIYWASYQGGKRIAGPSVNKPSEVDGFIIDQYPSPRKMVALASSENYLEPLYLRRPDAVATADR
jgi:tRNA A37 threonylcarbamoyladenosine modification protein TsaB